jgi:hypothetical protein
MSYIKKRRPFSWPRLCFGIGECCELIGFFTDFLRERGLKLSEVNKRKRGEAYGLYDCRFNWFRCLGLFGGRFTQSGKILRSVL